MTPLFLDAYRLRTDSEEMSRLCSHIIIALQSEEDEKIRTNMIGSVSWSLLSMLQDPEPHSGVALTYDTEPFRLTSVSYCYPMAFQDEPLSMRVGARMWIAKDARNQHYPTLYHICPGVAFARVLKCKKAWTSFNEDRQALQRRISVLKTSEFAVVQSTWKDWQIDASPKLINNVQQYAAWINLNP